jgi:hypothetical protein
MKKLTIAALIAAQTLTVATPAAAADIAEARETRPGAFAGLRLRVPLDGGAHQRQVRAGLTVAPTLHSRSADGAVRGRIGEGLELGATPGRAPALTLAGTRVDRLGAPDGRRANISTEGWIAIGAGTLIVLSLLTLVAFDEISDQSE